MKYTRIIIILTVLPLLLVGCGGGKEVVKRDFTTFELKGDTLPMEILATFPKLFTLDDSLLLVTSIRDEPLFKVYRKDSSEPIATYGSLGRSNLEFLQPVVTTLLGDTIIVNDASTAMIAEIKYDVNLNQFREIERNDYQRRKPDSLSNYFALDFPINKLSDGNYVGSSLNAYDKLFSYYDSDLKFQSNFGVLEELKGAEAMSIKSYSQSYLASYNNILVSASLDLPYISAYSIRDGEPTKMWDDRIYPLYVKVDGGGIKYDREKARGKFGCVTMSDRFIYVLFRDIYLRDNREVDNGSIVLVYDYEGNRLARLNLPEYLYCIAVEKNDSELYGIEFIETKIMSYDIKDIASEF